jgi:hypothetical protein
MEIPESNVIVLAVNENVWPLHLEKALFLLRERGGSVAIKLQGGTAVSLVRLAETLFLGLNCHVCRDSDGQRISAENLEQMEKEMLESLV